MVTTNNASNISEVGVISNQGNGIFVGSAVNQYNVVVGDASNALTDVGPGSAGQVLQSGGNASPPAYSTATYPVTAGTSGHVLTSDGTNFNSSAPAPPAGTITQYDVLVGDAASAIASVGPGSAGQILQSGGNAAPPAYSTATYPATAGTSGHVLTSDGTNFSSSVPKVPKWNLISAANISSQATVTFNSNLTLYNELMFEFVSVVAADQTNVWNMKMSADNGSTGINGTFAGSVATTAFTANGSPMPICSTGGSSFVLGTAGVNGTITIDNSNLSIIRSGRIALSTTTTTTRNATGNFNTSAQSAQLNYVQFSRASSANFNSGTINCYGR